MLVTDIFDYDKRKVLVQLDGYLMFPLYKGEVTKYRLQKDCEISDAVRIEIVEGLLPKRVKLRAMNLLQKRSYTTVGLRRKLLEGHYPEAMVEAAIEYVTSYGYLDDVRYAEEYIRCYSEKRSKRRIMQDLFTKGISAVVAEQTWHQYELENIPVDEEGQIIELLCKKKFDTETADSKERIKMMNYLYRKGYSLDSINRCMKSEWE